MKTEKLLWIIIACEFALLCFGFVFFLYVIGDVYDDGFSDGKNQFAHEIIEIASRGGSVQVYDPIEERQILLIDLNKSADLCLDWLEDLE